MKEDTNFVVKREDETGEEHKLQNEIRATKEIFEKAYQKDCEASIALANACLSCIILFPSNPFQDRESHLPQQSQWFTSAI